MMKKGDDWWAKGYVASKVEAFKGKHVNNMMFIMDEAVGLPEMYFDATKKMFKSDANHIWICLYNPTDRNSQMYQEIIRPDSDWRVMSLSSLEHPNILAELRGEPKPMPAGVSLQQLVDGIKDDCEEVRAEERQATDFFWPPADDCPACMAKVPEKGKECQVCKGIGKLKPGKWLRPGPSFEANFLGRWPSADEYSLWGEGLWGEITRPIGWDEVRVAIEAIPRIGGDIASGGKDKCANHVSWDGYSVFHESRSGKNEMATVGHLIDLADFWADKANGIRAIHCKSLITGKDIPMNIDDDNAGGAIVSRLREQGYRAFGVGAATLAMQPKRYPNKRSELWFATRDMARIKRVNLGLLPYKVLAELHRQAMSPLWAPNSLGQRVVEPKDETRKRLGKSPDDMDAMNLSYYHLDYRAPEVLDLGQSVPIRDRIANERSGQRDARNALDYVPGRPYTKLRFGQQRRGGLFRR